MDFYFFAKNMDKFIGKNISKNLSGKYRLKLFDHAKQSTTDVLKNSSKRVIQETAEVTGDFIGNKIANRITKGSKTLEKKEYLKKDIYLQKKDRKLLMI